VAAPLFWSVALGKLDLPNRIVMSPMTRNRATLHGVPTADMAEYYRQRATAGLIISEGTSPSPGGQGYLFTPGIFSDEQVAHWRDVTDAVHQEGGRIFCQLMHCGRLSDPLLLPGQADPVAPSAVQPARDGLFTFHCPRPNRPYPRPRALETIEVEAIIEEYRMAADNALRAGFDGVELHAGNGYLPMQFLSQNVNLRQDRFGGNIEGRCRFLLEVVDAVATAIGPSRLGVRLHPGQEFADVRDDDPVATYSFLVSALSQRGIGYLHLSRRPVGWNVIETLRPLFAGPLIVGGSFGREEAAQYLDRDKCDLIAFGQAYIANPDLVERFAQGLTLNRPDLATYYTQGNEGYTDYAVFQDCDRADQCPPDMAFGSALKAKAARGGAEA
jgi:N-ethylmaleimide reductase